MQILDLIARKRNNEELTGEEIKYLVNDYTAGNIPDYQMSAFLMAVYFRGFSDSELFAYTRALVESGEILSWDDLPGNVVDKHSSGGVGDKTTLVVAPLVASAGLYMPKMSGRGLGFTGGTIDKLESIPGFCPEISPAAMRRQVKSIGLAVVSQTDDLAPADGKIYALRDVTATVESIPLISGSIMSKKIAGGAGNIILDVKVGSGAFMKQEDEAVKLAQTMVKLGNNMDRKVKAVISSMDQPLGMAIGNALEIEEVLSTLRGNGPPDLQELALTLSAHLLLDAGKAESVENARSYLEKLLTGGQAYEKFMQMVEAQQGDPLALEKGNVPRAYLQEVVRSPKKGYVHVMDAYALGRMSLYLGAGRMSKGDAVDHSAGVIVHRKIGDKVEKEEPLLTLYTNDSQKLNAGLKESAQAYNIGEHQELPPSLVCHIIGA